MSETEFAPDISEAERFLTLMAEGEPVTFQTYGERANSAKLTRVMHGTLDQHHELLAKLNHAGAGIFWMVNFGNGEGRAAKNVTGVRALFVDLDGAPLAPIQAAGLSPHAVIESSPDRWHAYWLVGECPPERFKPLQQVLAQRFGGDRAVCDLPRVMRLPGFWHVKARPFRSRIVSLDSVQPYPLADIVARLQLKPAQAPRPAPSTASIRVDTFAEGQRNAGLAQLAGAMRRKGMGREAIEAGLLAENRTRCAPPLSETEVRAIAASVARYAPEQETVRTSAPSAPDASDMWPPLALPGAIRAPEIPAEILPGWVGDMATAVAAWSQTPPAMATMIALSVLAAVLQRRFEVAPWGDDYREPLAVWTLTALPSGTRKTAVLNALTAPLVRWEKLVRDRMRTEIARAWAAREVANKRIEKLKMDAAKAESAEKRRLIQDEIQREREEMPAELFAWRIFTSDTTAERLQQLLVEQNESMSVFTDEGGIFGIMAGQYSGGTASLDIFLQGHSGSSGRVDRAGRFAHLDRPALSFGLALQPGMLADADKSGRFRASGLLARFLYAIPKSNVGERDVRTHRVLPPDVSDAWERNLLSLLDDQQRPIGAPKILPFDDAARERWLEFGEHIERHQGEGGRWAHMSDWTSKLPGAAARIAALLELAMRGIAADSVGDDSMRRALELCRLLTLHAEAAFRLMGTVDAEGDAVALLRWIEANRLTQFTRHEVHRAMEGRFRTVARLLAAIRVLQEWAVLSPERQRRNPRARATAFYLVSPLLFVDDSR